MYRIIYKQYMYIQVIPSLPAYHTNYKYQVMPSSLYNVQVTHVHGQSYNMYL